MVKRILVLLLALALLTAGMPALAGAEEGVTVEVNTSKLPVYAADDACLAGLLAAEAGEDETLPVLVLPVKKSYTINASVQPRDLRNRKVALSVADETVVAVRGTSITGKQAGETVLTVAAEAHPGSEAKFRVLVVAPVTRVALSAAEKKVGVGATLPLSVSYVPADAAMQQVAWTSSDERIATVDASGVVTGVKRGNVRITAATLDGGNVRASLNIQVVQNAESITLEPAELTIAAGKSHSLKANVLPKDTNDKGVTWSSSNPAVATVNANGKVSGVALGECDIICTSKTSGQVQGVAKVHVTQPVTKITFDPAPEIYVGETGQLTWHVEPANASVQAVALTSGNKNVLRVSPDGTFTGLKAGETYVNAVSTDGTNRQNRVKVRILQHVTGVHMKRHDAYIDVKEVATVSAIIAPKDASNQNMSWVMVDDNIAEVSLANKAGNKVKIKGLSEGITKLIGTTEDGGYETSLTVHIGDWDHALKIQEAKWPGPTDENPEVYLKIRNDSSLTITRIVVEVEVLDNAGKPVECAKDGGTKFRMEYRRTLNSGEVTNPKHWKLVNFKQPTSLTVSTYRVTIYQYIVDDDWVKTIREWRRPEKKIPIHA